LTHLISEWYGFVPKAIAGSKDAKVKGVAEARAYALTDNAHTSPTDPNQFNCARVRPREGSPE
jgi:hypothetical protein